MVQLKNLKGGIKESNGSKGRPLSLEKIVETVKGNGEKERIKKEEANLKKEEMDDPEFLFSIAFDEVQTEIKRVMRKNHLNDEELDRLIKKNYPNEYKRIWGELYDKINTDIWGKYEDGVLTVEEMEGWKKDLERWEGEWMVILEKIKNQI